MVMSTDDLDRQARAINDEKEARRVKVVAKIKKAEDTRKADAAVAQEQQRIADLAAMKIEVKRSWMLTNYLMSEADFEKAWTQDKLQLIREHKVKLASLPRM